MRYKLVIDEKHRDAESQQKIKRDSGQHFNDFPLNMREISSSDFWHWFSTYTPFATEFRQPLLPKEPGDIARSFWGNLTLLYSNYTCTEGYAFTTKWDYTQPNGGPHDFWPRFFKFGECIHIDTARTIGSCLTRYTCQKCGRSYTIDSSD